MVTQMANTWLLVAGLGVLCCHFASPAVARNYLLMIACCDIGHVYTVYSGLGADLFFDVNRWNYMVWGHVGITAFIFMNRLATLAGVFGKMPKQGMKQE